MKFAQIAQGAWLQCPDAVAIQVQVLERWQPIEGVRVDLSDLILVQENRMQMHFTGKHSGGHLSDVVVPQISGRRWGAKGIKWAVIRGAEAARGIYHSAKDSLKAC